MVDLNVFFHENLKQDLLEMGIEHNKCRELVRRFIYIRIEIKQAFKYLFSIGMVTDLTFEEYKEGLSMEQLKKLFTQRIWHMYPVFKKYL